MKTRLIAKTSIFALQVSEVWSILNKGVICTGTVLHCSGENKGGRMRSRQDQMINRLLMSFSFLESGDPRSVICTINGLPFTYEGTCTTIMNDRNLFVVARDISMFLMASLPNPLSLFKILYPQQY